MRSSRPSPLTLTCFRASPPFRFVAHGATTSGRGLSQLEIKRPPDVRLAHAQPPAVAVVVHVLGWRRGLCHPCRRRRGVRHRRGASNACCHAALSVLRDSHGCVGNAGFLVGISNLQIMRTQLPARPRALPGMGMVMQHALEAMRTVFLGWAFW